MRKLIATILTTLLTTSAYAQDVSPTPARTTTFQLIQGNGFFITIPANWRRPAEEKKEDKFLALTDNNGWLTVNHEDIQNVPANVMRNFIETVSQKSAPEESFSESTQITIDGRAWDHFTGTYIENGAHMSCDYFTYSGAEGSFQIQAGYPTSKIDKYYQIVNEAAKSFMFRVPKNNAH